MNRRSLLIFLLIFVVATPISTANLPLQEKQYHNAPLFYQTIYVDDSNTQGPWDGSMEYPYQTINEGILHAMDGDTVYVFNGVYPEVLLINKTITLRGQQQENTIIDGLNNGSVLTIVRTNVSLRRFTIRNSGGYEADAGIMIGSNATTITECTLYRTRIGICVQNCSDANIHSCRFHTNGFGIVSSSSDDITISCDIFYHNGAGVFLSGSSCITITDSYADTNGIGFLAEESSHIEISRSAARDNDDNEGGMFFEDCQYVTVSNSYLVHNGVGINLINSSTCYINGCNFSLNTHFSCKLKQSLDSIIVTNCIFTENLRFGIYAEESACTISWSNLFRNKNYGLYAKSSVIDASYNWWGATSGPAHQGLSRADRGTWADKAISYRPWLTFPMPEIGPNWILEKAFQKPTYIDPWSEQIHFSDLDSDADGAPDWWELKWGYPATMWDDHAHLDPDNDSLNNIEECYMDGSGANPFSKDMFLEFDWTMSMVVNSTNKPPEKEVAAMIEAFARNNITLHVDTGELGGGEEMPTQSYISYAEIINIYWDFFLQNDLNNPRQRIFHYGIICDYSEGGGFAVMGWSHLNAFIISAQLLAELYPYYTKGWLTTAASMHEVGHTCGLIATVYAGIDNKNTIYPYYKEFWMYLPYRSMLNYHYTYSFLDYSDGSHGRQDFNDWGNLDFSFFKNTDFSYLV